MKLIIS